MTNLSKNKSDLRNLRLATVLVYALMLQLSLAASISAIQQSDSSTVYVVKISKATPEEIKALPDAKAQILTQIQFMEKFVRNKSSMLNQGLFYVSFEINPTVSNYSNLVDTPNNTVTKNLDLPATLGPTTSTNTDQKTNETASDLNKGQQAGQTPRTTSSQPTSKIH